MKKKKHILICQDISKCMYIIYNMFIKSICSYMHAFWYILTNRNVFFFYIYVDKSKCGFFLYIYWQIEMWFFLIYIDKSKCVFFSYILSLQTIYNVFSPYGRNRHIIYKLHIDLSKHLKLHAFFILCFNMCFINRVIAIARVRYIYVYYNMSLSIDL